MARLTLSEAADRLGIQHDSLRSQIRNKSISAKKVGPIWTVTEAEVERYRSVSLGNRGNRKEKRFRKAAGDE